MSAHVKNLLKSKQEKSTYVGPLTLAGVVSVNEPFKVVLRKSELGPTARECIDTFKEVPLPGTESFQYPRRSLTWCQKEEFWMAINTIGSGDNTLVSIPLRDWIQDSGVMKFIDDEDKVGSFKWYHQGKHVSEAEAIAINDQFDMEAYSTALETKAPPQRKRSFNPCSDAGPSSLLSTPQKDLNRLLDEGTPEAADSAALLLATQTSASSRSGRKSAKS